LNLYTFLTYATSGTAAPGCNGDAACNAGYWAGINAFQDAQNAGANTSVTWWLDVETSGSWSGNPGENALLVQGALNALHETEGIANVGIYASPGNWNDIVGNYQPDVPYWMADWLSPPSGPGSCSDYYTHWQSAEHLPTGPLEVVQFASAQYDEDYAC
jgi:GH25 family lysozyme M1 (1,4-beta-N-acetylmuramidase)